MDYLKSIFLFVMAGLCEIGGGYLIWLWLREGKGWKWLRRLRRRSQKTYTVGSYRKSSLYSYTSNEKMGTNRSRTV